MAFDGTLKFDTGIDKSGFESGLSKLGGIAKKGMAAVAGAVTAATGAMAALGTKALEAYADYEQLTGGVATLFGAQDMSLAAYAKSVGKTVDAVSEEYDRLLSAQSAVTDNAAAAFRTAGLSQNAYMETVTSFSAALIASLDGDTVKAAQAADQAIVDMADNANKMGSSMESIQNAYQGFAKQNYTMLDNLKLGYGGTKSEMERLLADAQAISGVEYHLESYADIVDAIHVIQTEMGITGTTAKEAAETISGSVSMTKAAWSNLLIGIADDSQDFEKLTDDLVDSAATVAENILPRAEVIFGGMVNMVSSLGNAAADAVVGLLSYAPKLADAGIAVVNALVKGIRRNAPAIASAALTAGMTLLEGIFSISADLLDLGAQLLVTLAEGIQAHLPEITETAQRIITQIAGSLAADLPLILSAGASIIGSLVSVIVENLPLIVESALQIIQSLCDTLLTGENLQKLLDAGIALLMSITQAIVDNLPLLIDIAIQILEFLCTELLAPENLLKLLEAGIEILMALVDAIIDNLDTLLIACEQIITTLVEELWKPETQEKLLELGFKLLKKLIEGLGKIGGQLLGFAVDLFDELTTAIENIDWGALGTAIVEGICSGLLDCDFVLSDFLDDFGENWLSGIKDVFGIHSPSKLMHDEVGEYLALGIGEGFAEQAAQIGQSITGTVSGWGARLSGTVQKAAQSAVQSAKAVYDKLPAEIRQPLSAAAESVTQWGASVAEQAVKAGRDFLAGTQEFLKLTPSEMAAHLHDALNRVISWGADLVQRGRDAAKELVSTVTDSISTLPARMANIGRDLVEGLWNGITGMGNWLRERISGFADSILSGFKETFGIHSPSRLMRDQVGKYLAQGLGVGFTEEIPEIGRDAARALSDLKLPAIRLETDLPDGKPRPAAPVIGSGAVSAMRAQRTDLMAGMAQPSATSEIINNYSYSTANHVPESRPVINVHVHMDASMDGDKIAEKVAERVDILQGETLEFDERGTAH